MTTEIKNHVKDFDGFLNEQKLNEELKFDNDNYFCQMILKYSKKKKISWYPNNDETDGLRSDMIQEIVKQPNITCEREGRMEYERSYFNSEQPELKLITNARFGNKGYGACWILPV